MYRGSYNCLSLYVLRAMKALGKFIKHTVVIMVVQ